jgi:16S rRNA G966 N2-methylase RsmD
MCVAREALPALLVDTDAHTVKVLREAARLMEFTGRNDDAVNFLDQLADRAERTE